MQTSANIPTYSALADTIGMLNVNVICDQADGPYTLELTSPPSQLVPGSLNGTLSLQLLTDSQTPLKLLLINAAKSLAGENGLVYRGNQQLQFAVLIPGNQWTVQGNLSENLKFQLLTSNDKR
ncbi:hypothetical protein GCM10022631_19580 [Deinococcus rubellus]|uniref:Uncharacterized protein n=1 Tax=Deinococcus rubellus TaxID=1889240 RepID=A0ABY5YFA2_9DEIO|nr:hypothetical protein [Deinococcus rubellus]UWX63752.1 hypothetical protein N0D28_13610 [Deinococcus rubellus]